ncbi:MAG: carboxylesterase family protein, partial [Myxococcota bacterium]
PTSTTPTADTGTEPDCQVEAPGEACVDGGKVVGVRVEEHWRWLGIPFAAPPLAELRWAPPAPVEPWDAPRVADDTGPLCPQYAGEPLAVVGSEDCLTVNVFAPAGAEDAPVLFFVHGGGHQQGDKASVLPGSDAFLYDGQSLAEQVGAVVVSANYRLGPFGFLAHPALDTEGEGSGNYGMLDQIQALSWTRDNVASFGGDPDRIVLFGESAGAVSVCRLLATPRTQGQFVGAILQSGACVASTQSAAEERGRAVATTLGCDGEDIASCLRDLDVATIMATLEPEIDISALGAGAYQGVVDGTILPDMPRDVIAAGQAHDVPVILGSNAQETGNTVGPVPDAEAYEASVRAWVAAAGLPAVVADLVLEAYPVDDYPSPRAAFVAVTSDARFTCSNQRDARLLAEAFDSPVYRYHFAQIPENGGLLSAVQGAFHGLELFYVFDQVDVYFERGPTDLATRDAMQAAWVELARSTSGDPLQALGWPTYDETERLTLLDDGATAGDDPRAAACDFWRSFTGG